MLTAREAISKFVPGVFEGWLGKPVYDGVTDPMIDESGQYVVAITTQTVESDLADGFVFGIGRIVALWIEEGPYRIRIWRLDEEKPQ